MRNISSVLKRKLDKRVQAGNDSISASLWVGRPETPLTESRFLETQTVLTTPGITKTAIAACHPKMMRDASEVCIAYIKDGVASVAKSEYNIRMEKHVWTGTSFSEPAEDVSICYDGEMRKTAAGTVELKTEKSPWVFWVHGGSMYARLLDGNETIRLAETQCHAVSAIRAMWSASGSFDFGLVVFFLLNGSLFYRQLVDGEWKDAEPVLFGPEGVSWTDIAAFRTWDYRVGVQAKASNGTIYELFTQYMGIAKQGEEHIDADIDAKTNLIALTYHTPRPSENVYVNSIEAGAPYGGLYEVKSPHIVSAENIPDENDDWGKMVKIVMSNHMREKSVADNATAFVLTDSNGTSMAATTAVLNVEDGLTITLSFINFNAMKGECTISYNPGFAVNMADTVLEYTELNFTPKRLVDPNIPIPEPLALWNE